MQERGTQTKYTALHYTALHYTILFIFLTIKHRHRTLVATNLPFAKATETHWAVPIGGRGRTRTLDAPCVRLHPPARRPGTPSHGTPGS